MKKRVLFAVLVFTIILSFQEVLSQTVYITKTGKKYHSENCSSLRKSSIPIDLKEALSKGYNACSKCNPPQLTGSTALTKEKSSFVRNSNSKSTVTSGRCQAITKKGTQCKRSAKPGSKYCWQHGG